MNYSYILYRIIGNDLPPRHKIGQTYENTKFILNHEPDFPGCEKQWILNRIVDRIAEEKIIILLEKHKRRYMRIPFIKEEYVAIFCNSTDSKEYPFYPFDAFSWLRHHKILYIMNVNGARNLALRQGKKLAEWILPFDGNCFFPLTGWQQLVEAIKAHSHTRYFIVQMYRLADNSDALQVGFDNWITWENAKRHFKSEPQIVFHHTIEEEFDESLRYGDLSKVEFLWRLGVHGVWDQWLGKKRLIGNRRSAEYGRFLEAGFIARLFSGNREAEENDVKRQEDREAGIDQLLRFIDQQMV